MMELADRPRRVAAESIWRHLWRLFRWSVNLRLLPRWREDRPDLLSRLVRPWLVEGLTRQGRLLLLLLPPLILLNVRREASFPLGVPAFLMALLLTSALAGRLLRPRLQLKRQPSGYGVVGEPWRCELSLTNTGPWTARDLSLREMKGARADWPSTWEQASLATLAPGAVARLYTQCRPRVRGYLQLTGVTVESQYPLLLTRSNVRLADSLQVPVLPAPWRGQLPHLVTLMRQAPKARGSTRPGARSGPIEYVDSRPFQMGDSVRRLDHRASGRRGEPMVRVYQGSTRSEQRNWRVIFDQSLVDFAPWQPRPRPPSAKVLDRRLALLYELARRGQGEGLDALEIWSDGAWRRADQQADLIDLVAGCRASTVFEPPPEQPADATVLCLFVTGRWDRSRADFVAAWRAAGFSLGVVVVPENEGSAGLLPVEPGCVELQE
ncbi:MAG: DUF58 domain-containing protein [Gammaproteobacteria bacterium]|nr:DUF58 domain-containing protein [Gammaproteobacteria bacterium]